MPTRECNLRLDLLLVGSILVFFVLFVFFLRLFYHVSLAFVICCIVLLDLGTHVIARM